MPIAKEIKNASGFSNMDEVMSAMPDDPDNLPEEGPRVGPSKKTRKRKSKPGQVSQPNFNDPFVTDKRYQEACSEMVGFGVKGAIERGFDTGARILDDESFKLNAKEHRTWDNFFYVLSKKAMFDVGHPVFLAVFFIITLCAQLGFRLMERTEAGQFVKEIFTPKPKEKEPVVIDADSDDDE